MQAEFLKLHQCLLTKAINLLATSVTLDENVNPRWGVALFSLHQLALTKLHYRALLSLVLNKKNLGKQKNNEEIAMAEILAKQLLEKLKPDLQCYKCKDLPGPHRDQRKRYSCIDASHLLCEKDKAKCPCGSFVGTKPSTIIDKLLEGFSYKMCDDYAAGCRVIKMSTGDFQKHQRNCPFRQVFCPVLACKEKRVLSQDIIGHLTSIHNYDFENILCLANFQEYVLTTL